MYLLGDSESELNRLQTQTNLLIDDTLFGLVNDGDKILDIGCGPGTNYGELIKRNHSLDYTGIDISPSAINIARAQYPNSQFICADVSDLDTLNLGQFDVVICKLLLWSIDSPPTILQSCKQRLNQYGKLYIFEPYSEGLVTFPPLKHFQHLTDHWHHQAAISNVNPSIGIEVASMLMRLQFSHIQSSVFQVSACRSEPEFKTICDNLISFYSGSGRSNPAHTINSSIHTKAKEELNSQCDFICDVFVRTIATR